MSDRLSLILKLILEDILDGYFPAILREKFPEGTPFELFSELDKYFLFLENCGLTKLSDYDEAVVKMNRSPNKKIGEINRTNHFVTNQSDKIRSLSNKPRDFSVNVKINFFEKFGNNFHRRNEKMILR